MTDQYDPNAIIQAADARLASNDLEGGQLVYQSALLDWVDFARESSEGDPEQLREAIATLWLAYAHFLRKAKQFKSATDAYEQAVSCPVAGNVGRVWLDYARFAEERDKKRTAQQVYLRALVGQGDATGGAVTDDQDRQLLWMEFLEFMRKSNPSLTLGGLQAAVQQEHVAGSTSPVPQSALSGAASPKRDATASPVPSGGAAKRSRFADASGPPEESKTHVVTIESIEAETQQLIQLATTSPNGLPPEIAAVWMVRDGDAPAQAPEPPLFGPTPPKLSDPTGKDMLGEELALRMMQCLLQPSGTALLEVCRALWMMTALQEMEAKKAMNQLDQQLTVETERLEATLDARLSVAGAAHDAVLQLNDQERSGHRHSMEQQRSSLFNGIAWQWRQLLCVQQQVLGHMKVPGFEGGPTVDGAALDLHARICSFLHSAFYLRKRIGEKHHKSMLESQVDRLNKERENAIDTGRSLSPVPPGGGYGRSLSPVAPGNYGYAQQQGQGLPPPPPPPPPHMGMPPQAAYGMPPQVMGYPQQQPPPVGMPPIMGNPQQQHQQPPHQPGAYGQQPPYYGYQ